MPPTLPLPRGWKRRVRSSVLRCVAQFICWNNGPFHGAPKPVHLRARTLRVAVLEMCLQGGLADLKGLALVTDNNLFLARMVLIHYM